MIFLLYLFIHVTGCMYFYLARFYNTWMPPSDSIYEPEAVYEDGRYGMKYWTIIYYSVMFFGINDISTTQVAETAYIAYVAILSAIVNANIFGTITVLI